MNTKRTFIAFDIIPNDLLSVNFEFVKHSLSDESIKWVDNKTFHVTLMFIGDTQIFQIEKINSVLQNICSKLSSFKVNISEFGVFPNKHNPRVLWFGLNYPQVLTDLKKNIANSLENLGFINDQKEFKPHLTLGRVRFLQNKNKVEALIENFKNTEFQSVEISKIIFYESILKPSGSIYKPLTIFNLL